MAPAPRYSGTVSLVVTLGAVLLLAEISFVLRESWAMAGAGAALILLFGLALRIADQRGDAEEPVIPTADPDVLERGLQASASTFELRHATRPDEPPRRSGTP
jgi:hypothetical protein